MDSSGSRPYLYFRRIDAKATDIKLDTGKHSFGRNIFFQCPDRRISRNHGCIEVEDTYIILSSLHSNPCFIKKNHSEEMMILHNGSSQKLYVGDQLGLLPSSFWYILASDNPEGQQKETAPDSPILDINVKEEMVDANEEDGLFVALSPSMLGPNENHEQKVSLEETQINLEESQPDNEETQVLNLEEKSITSGSSIADTIHLAASELIEPNRTAEALRRRCEDTDEEQPSLSKKRRIEEETQSDLTEAKAVVHPPLNIKYEPQSPTVEPVQGSSLEVKVKVEPNDDAKADGTKADGSNTDGTKADGSNTDGNKADGSNTDGTKANGSNTDGTKADGSKADGSKADGSKADGSKADGSKADGSKADGSKADGSKADGSNDGAAAGPSRERCMYGAQCYRKNPQHKLDFAHPQDPDWGTGPRKPCPWGARCVRRDSRHFRDHEHPQAAAPPLNVRPLGKKKEMDLSPRGRKKRAARRTSPPSSESSLQEEEDPFSTDGSDEWTP